MKTIAERFKALVSCDPVSGCHLWMGAKVTGGYGNFKRATKQPVLAHRMAWELAYGPIPKRMVIRHYVCSNPTCVNVAHLKMGTQKENVADTIREGRKARGSATNKSSLTESQVLNIRGAWNSGVVTQRQLAAAFGIRSNATINDIIHRKTWTHI